LSFSERCGRPGLQPSPKHGGGLNVDCCRFNCHANELSVGPNENPDIEFERRWTAWEARGLAHERTVRRRFLTVVIVTAAIALAALFAYKLLSP